jgi:hypothetical protein
VNILRLISVGRRRMVFGFPVRKEISFLSMFEGSWPTWQGIRRGVYGGDNRAACRGFRRLAYTRYSMLTFKK